MREALRHDSASAAFDSKLQQIAAELPPPPPVIRYFDDYADVTRSIKVLESTDIWPVESAGRKYKLNFGYFPAAMRPLLRSWTYWLLGTVEPHSACFYFEALRAIPGRLVLDLLGGVIGDPSRTKELWIRNVVSAGLSAAEISALKKLLNFLCEHGLGDWIPEQRGFVQLLPSGISTDKLGVVRKGTVFLSFPEERAIVEHFDTLSDRIRNGDHSTDDRELAASCLLYWAYAHGVRPIQIANRNVIHVRVRRANDGPPTVHLTFRYAKQRADNKRAECTRPMKRDWAWMMDEWVERRSSRELSFRPDREASLFGHTPGEVSQAIQRLTERLSGTPRSPRDLRHAAAQRMVDGGAPALELAEFMMHADIDTGQVYYDTSPTQADRINKALGLSPIYSELGEIIKTRKIDTAKLLGLPEDQQIGAAPHGFPIVGIGGCSLGQSLCARNPGLSCYECSKFMPLNEPGVHREARDAVAATVREFIDAAKLDDRNPAFMQLRRTLESIDAVIDDLTP